MRVAVYPLETVVTEKFAALVEIGEATTRMKDLYDLLVILRRETFEAGIVKEALTRSFAARGTPLDQIPNVLSPAFAASDVLTPRWAQYRRRTGLTAPDLIEVMTLLRAFYSPLLLGDRTTGHWQGGEWT